MKTKTWLTIVVMVLFVGWTMTFNYGGCGGSSKKSSGSSAPTTAPTAPSGLTANAYSNFSIKLTWTDNSTNESSFIIERSATSGTGFASVGQVTANLNYHIDIGLTPSTAYYYRVKASNAIGDSAYTTEANATTLGPVYSVSGNVTYPGLESGWVYIEVNQATGGPTYYGTSIETTPGAYTIRGLPPGDYTLSAWLDHLGTGVENASNPTGTATAFTVSSANVTGKDIALSDPAAPTPLPVTITAIAPSNTSAFVMWENNEDGNGNDIAESYKIKWGTSSGVYPNSKTVTANDEGMCWITGLTNSTPYYFVVSALVDLTESANSPEGTVTVGAPAGNYTVSGTVTFSGGTGPMFVGVYGNQAISYTYIASPTSPQSYSIGAVANGNYFLFAIIDVNSNGVIDAGDLENAGGESSQITVSGNMAGQNITLTGANGYAYCETNHWSNGTNESYSVSVAAGSGKKSVVKVVATDGPGLPATTDLRFDEGGGGIWLSRGTTRPTTADTYSLTVTYSDASTANLSVSVSGVLDSFANNLTTSGTANTPTFNWTAPTAPPASYTYGISVRRTTGNNDIWRYPDDGDMPSSQLSVVYNVDNKASEATLSSGGVTYYWQIQVEDSNGNSATRQATYSY